MESPNDLQKRREIAFHTTPPEQTDYALRFLTELPGLTVERRGQRLLEVRYSIQQHTLETLENALVMVGCHLETTLLSRLKRALYYYTERVQRENLQLPEVHSKDYSLAHAEAWLQRPHGDHDETPDEWRLYK